MTSNFDVIGWRKEETSAGPPRTAVGSSAGRCRDPTAGRPTDRHRRLAVVYMHKREDRAQQGRARIAVPWGERGRKDKEAAAEPECEYAVPDSALPGAASGLCRCRARVSLAPCGWRNTRAERERERERDKGAGGMAARSQRSAAAWTADRGGASRGLARRAARAGDTRPGNPGRGAGTGRQSSDAVPSATAQRRQPGRSGRLAPRAAGGPRAATRSHCTRKGRLRPAGHARAPRVPSPGGRRRQHGPARSP